MKMNEHDYTPQSPAPRSLLLAAMLLAAPMACGDDGEPSNETGADTSADTSGDVGTTEQAGSTSPTPGTGATDSTGEAALEIAGSWFEDFGDGTGITHNIDEDSWDQLSDFGDSLFAIDSYDNPGRWVVALGDANNEFNPNLYSKFNWAWDDDSDVLYYCTAVFDAQTVEAAQAAPDADSADLMTGCGGFPWSRLSPAE